MARPEAGVTVVDANMLRHVQENAVWFTTFCPEMDGGHFKHLL
jgi:hypothetical protein